MADELARVIERATKEHAQLNRAWAKGKIGRPPSVYAHIAAAVRAHLASGAPLERSARSMGCLDINNGCAGFWPHKCERCSNKMRAAIAAATGGGDG